MALRLLENDGILPLPANLTRGHGWTPGSAKQVTFINCKAQLCLYGGASGGAKSNALVADSAQEYDNPNFRGILLRKSYTEMTGLMDEMEKIYLPLGGRKADGGKIWRFPAGGIMRLGYMASDKHLELYTGKPISWLGIDECQFQPEDRVRKLFPWVSTPPEYGLRDRIRLTANPSTPWLKNIFLNNECPVCHPSKSTIPFAVYEGARWKKDDDPVMLTTCFIPALVTDNPYYGEQKIGKLMSQSAEIRKKLLDGCWCSTEGAFFSFLNDSYIVPISEAGEQWWHTHFISMDYGYSSSAAACGLYFANEFGRIYKIGELLERKMASEEFSHHVGKMFLQRTIGGQRCRITEGYADPAMDAHTGTGKSNLDIINGVLDGYGMYLMKAAKDRIGNAQMLHGKLSRREFILTDAVPKSYESLNSRIHDPDMPGAILKVPGDELDDSLDSDLYGLNNYLRGAGKPKEIEIEEKMQQLRENGVDEKSVMVQRWRMQQKMEQTSVPPTIGRPTIGSISR